MGALKNSAASSSSSRYVAELNWQEDRIAVLRQETADLEQKLERAQTELAALIEALAVDVDVLEAGADGDPDVQLVRR